MKNKKNKEKKVFKALVVGGGPIGILWFFALHFMGFTVYISETSTSRKTTIKKLIGEKVRFFDKYVAEHENMQFDIVVMCTSSGKAYEDVFDFVKNKGIIYLFSGIDDAYHTPIFAPYRLANLDEIHRRGLRLSVETENGKLIHLIGHSGASSKGWADAIKALPQWAPYIGKIFTGVIEGFDSKVVKSWQDKLKNYLPDWISADERIPVVEYVLKYESTWELNKIHLKLSIISTEALKFFKKYLSKGLTKNSLRSPKTHWWTLQTSRIGIRLSSIYSKPTKPKVGWVLLKIIAVNPCTADLRADSGKKKGGRDYKQALHNGFGIVIMVNSEGKFVNIKIGDVVVVNPHVYETFHKNSIYFTTGDFFKIIDDHHMGIDVDGAGGEYCTVPIENCVLIPKDIVRAVIKNVSQEGNIDDKGLKIGCAILAELEHIACIFTGINLLRQLDKDEGGILKEYLGKNIVTGVKE